MCSCFILHVHSSVVAVHSPSLVRLFATPWTAAHQASLSLIISQNLPKFMSIALVMPSSHRILWHPLLPSVFPSIRAFSNELAVCIRWPKYWSFNFSISPSNKYSKLISLKIGWFDLLDVPVFSGRYQHLQTVSVVSVPSIAPTWTQIVLPLCLVPCGERGMGRGRRALVVCQLGLLPSSCGFPGL